MGIIGAGRIGSAYARMMVEGHKASTPSPGPMHVSSSQAGKVALSRCDDNAPLTLTLPSQLTVAYLSRHSHLSPAQSL